jgi:hypothetical protein
MRNRTLEAAAILAVGLFTTLSVGTYIHQLNTQEGHIPDKLGVIARRAMHWMQSQPGPAAVPIVKAASKETDISKDYESASSPLQSIPTDTAANWLSKTDEDHLLSIARNLSSRMTTGDWMQLANMLENTNSPQTTAQVASLLTSKLTAGDQVWLKAHFQGPQSFTEEDVSLLKDAMTQIQDMLTPDEQSLLKKELAQLGIDIRGQG